MTYNRIVPLERRRQLMDLANAAGLELEGKQVVVSGCQLDFALVFYMDDLTGQQRFLATYAWSTLEELVTRNRSSSAT